MGKVFGIVSGGDIPAQLAHGLTKRHPSPRDLAQVTVLVNSDRMAKALRQSFIQNGPGLLPKITTIAQASNLFLSGPVEKPSSTLLRLLTLFPLVEKFIQEPNGIFAGSSSFVMAQSLDALIREFHAEGIALSDIQTLNPTQESAYWQNTSGFLSIVEQYWHENGAITTAEQIQRDNVKAIVDAWATSPPAHPIYIAGSTGSRALTRLLMQAVTQLPQGAIILPAYDPYLPAQTWRYLQNAPQSQDHPQHRFAAMLDLLKITPKDIEPWTTPSATSNPRRLALSVALRPAPVTHIWRKEARNIGVLGQAFKDVSLIEAETPEEEAQAIALASYTALAEKKSVAIVTPDRILSRRIAAYLAHWKITADDSAGVPLHHSAPGRLMRHMARICAEYPSNTHLFECLKHPMVHAGADRNNHLRLTRDLEIELRRNHPGAILAGTLRAWAQDKEPLHHSWTEWIIDTFLSPMNAQPQPLTQWLTANLHQLEKANQGSQPDASLTMWSHKEGQQVQSLIQELEDSAAIGPIMRGSEYQNMINVLLARETQRSSAVQTHDIVIWGTQEARSVQTDVVILAGLNEGVWPAQSEPDPWLSRAMRAKLGLFLPERQLGLSAHDFEHLANAPHVIFSRATMDSDKQTVPSRWINRLSNLLGGLNQSLATEYQMPFDGPETLDQIKKRGHTWLDRARQYFNAAPLSITPAARPSPSPPLSARPKRLSITEIERLIRDPYEIYAKHVLNLRPLDPFDHSAFYRLRGTLLHRLLEECVHSKIDEPSEILARANALLEHELPDLKERVATQLSLSSNIDHITQFLNRSLRDATHSATEVKAIMPLLGGQFELTGQIDRIDIMRDGMAYLYDYKTGTLPTQKQQLLYNQQLFLSALLVQEGRLKEHENCAVTAAEFISILKANIQPAPFDKQNISQTKDKLKRLISRYFAGSTGYSARRAMFKLEDASPYDHLARLGEWDVVDLPVFNKVGTRDA